ncbi:MAG: TPM domain-containing protein [Clostridia bacterium]|nr:TPM domain-containing protein [Clostridia bacterium]
MKKLALILFALLLLGCFAVPALAAETPYVSIDADLTEEQAAELNALEKHIEETYGFEAAFWLDNTLPDSDSFTSDVKSFMYQHTATTNAMAFGVSAESYFVASMGKAANYVTNDDADTLYAAIKDADKRGDSYAAAVQFYEGLTQLLKEKTRPAELPKTNLRLMDAADVLTADEEATLLDRLNKVSEQYKFDFVIVTVPDTNNWELEAFAGEYFVQNNFGYGEDQLGCTLVFDLGGWQWYVSAPDGESANAVNLYCIDYLADHTDFQDDLRGEKYYDAFDGYIDFVTDCVNEAQVKKPYGTHHRIDNAKHKTIGVIVSLVIGLIISAITTKSVKSGYTNAVHKNSGAGDYLVQNSLVMRDSRDQFLYTTVNKTPRPKDNDSGSSSSGGRSSGGTHYTSSSGRSFTGGGRKL